MSLPHSFEAERALLGALLRGERQGNDEAIGLLTPEHFLRPPHVHIFTAIARMADAGRPYEPAAVGEELRRAGVLEECGGFNGLRAMRDYATGDPVASVSVLADDFMRRRLIIAAAEITQLAHDSTDEASEAVDKALRLIENAAGDASDVLPPTADRVDERIRQIETGEDPEIIPTGISELDEMIGGGLKPGRMYVIAAESGVGKSAVSLQIADYSASRGRPVLYVSYEMLWDEVLNRRVSMHTNLPTSVVENAHHMTGGAKPRIIKALEDMRDDPLYIEDSFSVGMPGIKARVRRLLREQNGPPIVVIDYLQQAPTQAKGELAAQIEALSKDAHRIAKLRVPVIVVAQMNRTGDIFGSGGIKRYADCVIELEAIRNDLTDDILQLNLRVKKQRAGRINAVATFEPIGADFLLHPKKDISSTPGALPPAGKYAKAKR